MSHNVSGQAYALSVLTPILDGHAPELTAHLESLAEGDASPLARVPGTHIARWAVIVEAEGFELKDMESGEQRPASEDELMETFAR